MSLTEQVTREIADAMKAHDPMRLGALRMLKTALMNREVEKKRSLDANEELQVVSSLIKQRRDSIEQFTRGNRQDLADRETAEIRILESYVPAGLDPAEIDEAVKAAVADTGATSTKDFGKVMKAVMARFAGRPVDGKAVSESVKRALGG